MRLYRIRAVCRKEFLHILRDPRSLLMGIAIPVLMLLLFGYALALDVDNVPLVVIDRDNSPGSRAFIETFSASRYFSLVGHADDYPQVEDAIDRGDAMMAIVIPPSFCSDASAGKTVTFQMIIDGSDSGTATIAIAYASSLVTSFSRKIASEVMMRSGGKPIAMPLDVRPRVWYNADMESRNYIIPGLIPVIMMVIAALLTSLTIAREWETGTMEQLISTPVKGSELIIGKLAPYFCIGFLDVIIAVLMGMFVFGVPLRGNPLIVLTMSAVFLTGALSLGILISIVAKSQLVATQFALITTFLPAFLLSGFMFDIANMPRFIQVVTYIIPARYLITILRSVYLKGTGWHIVAVEVLFLTVFGIAVFAVANALFRKRLN